jgi:hypothetical protein
MRVRTATAWRHSLPPAGALLCMLWATPSPAAPAPGASVEVDARAAPRGIMTAHLVLPVTAGPLTLVYPKWLPGRHSPAGPVTSLGGIKFAAGGRTLPWRRDPVDLYAFHLDVPAGVAQLDADLEILTSPAPDGVVQGLETPRTATDSLLILEWNQLVLYPAQSRTDDLSYRAAVRPHRWLRRRTQQGCNSRRYRLPPWSTPPCSPDVTCARCRSAGRPP